MDNDTPGCVCISTGTVKSDRAYASLTVRRALARRAGMLDRTHGRCYCCGLPWSVVSHHSTPYSRRNACFPLCQLCWRLLTPDERLPYYRRLWEDWGDSKPPWARIAGAVLAGK